MKSHGGEHVLAELADTRDLAVHAQPGKAEVDVDAVAPRVGEVSRDGLGQEDRVRVCVRHRVAVSGGRQRPSTMAERRSVVPPGAPLGFDAARER